MPTQKDIDEMNALLKKVPTPEQTAELSKISEVFHNKYKPLSSEQEKLGAEIERATRSPGFLLTKAHVNAAMINHKKLRALYIEHFSAIADWGRRSGQASCTRQAERTQLYTIRVSDQWLAIVDALPLGTTEERLYAGQYVGTGGGDVTFQPDPEPVISPENMVGAELVRLGGVCMGARAEYVPGANK